MQSGGFGSFSKGFGTAAAGLLEAEVVTADGKVRIANACTNPDLFWALKGGGGGSFGVITKLTLRTHELPEFFGFVGGKIKAQSDAAFRDHLAALAKSISAVGVCNVCGGEGRNRCTNCHGQKETKIVCQKCKGKGHTISSLGAQVLCNPCKATGYSLLIKCEKCKDGFYECKQCDK